MTDTTAYAAGSAARARTPRQPVFKPGVVQATSLNQQIAYVAIDADNLMYADGGGDHLPSNGNAQCQIIIGSGLTVGDRVMVMFVPPNGAYVVGRFAGDYNAWTLVGATASAIFVSPWGNAGGVGIIGQTNTWQQPSLRRIGRMIELRGRAARGSGGAPNPDTVFTLAPELRPINDIVVPSICGPIAIPAFVIVRNTGEVQAFLTGGSTVAPDGFITLDGIVYSTDQRG